MRQESVSLVIPGKPVPKKRPRVVRGHAFTPRESVEYESRVAYEARRSRVTYLPGVKVSVTLIFHLHSRGYKLTDVDNLIKSALDGLVKGGMFNDRDVDQVIATKRMCAGDEEQTIAFVASLENLPN